MKEQEFIEIDFILGLLKPNAKKIFGEIVLAKKNKSAVICEIMDDDGTMARGEKLHNFAKKHKLKIGKIDDLIAYRLKKEKLIKLKKKSNIAVV